MPVQWIRVLTFSTVMCFGAGACAEDPTRPWSEGWRLGQVSAVREGPAEGRGACAEAVRAGQAALTVKYRSAGKPRWVTVPMAAAPASHPAIGATVVVNLQSCKWEAR